MKVAVLGLGYVGLPVVLAAVEAGLPVVGFDVSAERLATLELGRSAVDTVADDSLRRAIDTGRLTFTNDPADLADATVYVICVPTPLRDKLPDLSMVRSAVGFVAHALRLGDLVSLESTTYPGTTDGLVAEQIEQISSLVAGRDYHLVFSPERIDPGNHDFGFGNTPKIVGGVTEKCTETGAAFYRRLVERVVTVSSPRVAETAKLLENTFRHVNIALANEMAVFCRELGIDLHEAIRAAATKPFGFMPFYPGPGVGGHCIPIDPAYFSWRVRQLGLSFRFVELATEINDRMPPYVASRVVEMLNAVRKPLNGASVILIGVAYKAEIGDLRESPAFPLARRLLLAGARVCWHDPHIPEFTVDGQPLPEVKSLDADSLSGVDLAILHTPHSCIDLDGLVRNAPLVLDTRGAIKARPSHVHAL
ncbi:nucleotide sugar dehydrogenase [Streptomyces sp. NPDC001792]|uniref:nucleotide sugar dehydrogenase n=1 Tax=Streptomyces sp. NPDC001792 TaxID=3154524 RepID=UPI00332E661C